MWCSAAPVYTVMDRTRLGLDDQILPLARGGVIPRNEWFWRRGFRPTVGRPRHWTRSDAGLYEHTFKNFELMVKRLVSGLWMPIRINRLVSPLGWQKEAFVHVLGASPVLTKRLGQAIFLAETYGTDAPLGFRWAEVHPVHLLDAIDYARHRNFREWRAPNH